MQIYQKSFLERAGPLEPSTAPTPTLNFLPQEEQVPPQLGAGHSPAPHRPAGSNHQPHVGPPREGERARP